ncbi:MAG: antitoxin VapB family protein [Candidatus Kariarchaeaceae archaeon]|jgi:predicted CopG family antitoxin
MTTKTITIKEDVYYKLLRLKREKESFSQLLNRLASNISSLELLSQMQGTIEFNDKDGILEDIRHKRDSWRSK